MSTRVALEAESGPGGFNGCTLRRQPVADLKPETAVQAAVGAQLTRSGLLDVFTPSKAWDLADVRFSALEG
jgi:hypothetical protein